MTTPLEKIIAILLPGTKKRETTEERFEAIWSQLKLLGWKAKKSAKHNWVQPYSPQPYPPRAPPSHPALPPTAYPFSKRNLKDGPTHFPCYNSRCTIHQTGAIGCVQQRPRKLFRQWCLPRAELSSMKANDNRDVLEVMIPRWRQWGHYLKRLPKLVPF